MPHPISRHLRAQRLGLLMWSSICGGAVLLVASIQALHGTPFWGEHAAAFAVFAALLIATELKPIPSLTDDTELTASWAFAFTLLFIAPLAGALMAVAIAPFLADVRRGKRVDRSLFNAAQFMLSLALGGMVGSLIEDVSLVGHGGSVTLRWLVAVAVACAVGFAANSVFISLAIAFHQGLPVTEMLRRSLGINLEMDGLLLALAPIFVVIGLQALVLVPLLLLTVWIIFRSASLALRNKHDATHDQLTGSANRRMFEDHAQLIVDAAKASNSSFALVHIDLDGFKGINDRLGHHFGDLVLVEVARRLREGDRSTDFSARLGGDEFALLLADVPDAAIASALAERVLRTICEPLSVEGVPLTIGASMGVALFPRHGEDIDQLLHHADIAMYEAKQGGGGIRLFDGVDDAPGPRRLGLLTELTNAIEHGELSLAYQPKVDVDSGRVSTVEALLRWEHPEHGPINPGWFMPQAEQTDLITPLTDHVIELALAQCRHWADDGIAVQIAVNVSARNLHDLRFPARVGDALERHGLDPSVIEIEITENSVMEDPLRSAAVLAQLRRIGVGLAIDDFGTGYSSLSVLRELEVDRIKIDRSFVTNLASNDGDLTIVRSVIELGHNLGLRTVAEGVETIGALQILRDIGCDEIQGYLLSVPLSADLVTPILRRGHISLDELRPLGAGS